MGKIAVVGLGLIGGSMGLALKNLRLADTEIVGYDRDAETAERAVRLGAADRVEPSLPAVVQDASLVIVATPVTSLQAVFTEMSEHLVPGAVVTDTASTKTNVLRWARDLLPSAHFVGGHPMAGKEQSGNQAAEADLFQDRPYCIVPSLNASPTAVNAVVGLIEMIGAQTFFLDAAEHDAYAAGISHVPLVASVALFNLARSSAAWPELATMAGPAFRDLTRLASGAPEMAHDICLTNRENITHWLRRYIDELERLSGLIANDDSEALFRAFAEPRIQREDYLDNPPVHKEPFVGTGPTTSPGEAFMDLMAGSLWRERSKLLQQGFEKRAQERRNDERLRRGD
jgi:prephenate dehydrogenase